MKLHLNPRETTDPDHPWSAETDDGNYDARGRTALEAAMALGDKLSEELKQVGL